MSYEHAKPRRQQLLQAGCCSGHFTRRSVVLSVGVHDTRLQGIDAHLGTSDNRSGSAIRPACVGSCQERSQSYFMSNLGILRSCCAYHDTNVSYMMQKRKEEASTAHYRHHCRQSHNLEAPPPHATGYPQSPIFNTMLLYAPCQMIRIGSRCSVHRTNTGEVRECSEMDGMPSTLFLVALYLAGGHSQYSPRELILQRFLCTHLL